jgi:hypothetical protein
MYDFENLKEIVKNDEGYMEGVKWFYKMSKTARETELVPETLPNSTYKNVIDNTDPMNPITETVRRTRSEYHYDNYEPKRSPD